MIIHSHHAEKKGQKKADASKHDNKLEKFCRTDPINLPDRFQIGLANPSAGPKDFIDHVNPYGFYVRATNNGSMTQDIFYDYCVMFVDNLEKCQGKDRKPHIILFDGHASQWNLEALEHLMSHNVYPFFCPLTRQFGHSQMTTGLIFGSILVLRRPLKDSETQATKIQYGFTILL